MNYLSKINRGAILTTIVILGVIGYLTATAMIQNKEKPAIKKVCEAYVETEVSYNMLPSEYRKDMPDMSVTALNGYLSEMRKDITAFYPDNEQNYKYIIQTLTDNLTLQNDGQGVVYQYEKKILRYDSFIFDGDTVTVGMTCDTTIETRNSTGTGSSVKSKTTSEISDSIILQKTDGEWKVLYASLNRPGSDYSGYKEVPNVVTD